MNAPDLSTLPQRMRWAAAVLQETDHRYFARHHNDNLTACVWNSAMLHRWADEWEAEDHQGADREALVKELAQELLAAFGCDPILARKSTRITAELLIQRGWRKGDPA